MVISTEVAATFRVPWNVVQGLAEFPSFISCKYCASCCQRCKNAAKLFLDRPIVLLTRTCRDG